MTLRAIVSVTLGALVAPGALAFGQSHTVDGITVSGFVESSYTHSSAAAGGMVVGRLFDQYHDQFMLNGLELSLDKGIDAAKMSAGFHADFLFGQNAGRFQAAGLDLGDQGDMPQAYAVLNVPTPNGAGVQIKAGKLISLPGVESVYDINNPNITLGFQATYVEMATGTGVDAEHRFNSHLDAEVRVLNGWDVVRDNNHHVSVGARAGITPDAATNLNLVAWTGPEELSNDSSMRYGFDAVASRRIGARASVSLQGDYGREDANPALADPTQDAQWWGLGAWLDYASRAAFDVAVRADYLDDENGARTSGVLGFPANIGQRVGSGTLTVNIHAWPGAMVRPEVRYDRSSLPAFNGERHQWTAAMSVAYVF